jgi:hypothetical protein
VLIEGHARGADQAAHNWAIANGFNRCRHEWQAFGGCGCAVEPRLICRPADWKHYGIAAGPIRNGWMLKDKPDVVVGFHDAIEESKGTGDMLLKAHDAGIPYTCLQHPYLTGFLDIRLDDATRLKHD